MEKEKQGQIEKTKGLIKEILAGSLRMRPEDIKDEDRLLDLGVDSIMKIEVADKMEKSVAGFIADMGTIVEIETVDGLVDYLFDEQQKLEK